MTHQPTEASFWEHLDELRSTLIRVIVVIGMSACVAFAFSSELVDLVATSYPQDLKAEAPGLTQSSLHLRVIKNIGSSETSIQLTPRQHLFQSELGKQGASVKSVPIPPNGEVIIQEEVREPRLIILSPVEGMLTALKVSLWAGIILSSPIWVFLLMRFVLPALTSRERSATLLSLPLCLSFFFLGLLAAVKVSLPLANAFLFAFNSGIGENLWTAKGYLDFVLWLSLANGLAFTAGAVLLILVHYGAVEADLLRKKRRVVILGIFVAAAILTPPDVFTQCLLAVPMILLYEGTVLYATIKERSARQTELVRSS